MRKYREINLIFYIILIVAFFTITSCNKKIDKYRILKTPKKIIDKLGNKRSFRLFMPADRNPVPMIVYFHGVMSKEFKKMDVLKGYTGSPVEETGLISFCRVRKIALLIPEPFYSFKFLNVKATGWSPFHKEIDGIEKIISVVSKSYNIDKDSIYLAGISAGAVLSHHLANRHPERYRAILSHSQAYISEDGKILYPSKGHVKFGVVFCYTRGDYKNLKELCSESYKVYKKSGYKTVLLKDLPPTSHKWAVSYNKLFWKLLVRSGRK